MVLGMMKRGAVLLAIGLLALVSLAAAQDYNPGEGEEYKKKKDEKSDER